MDGPRRSRVIYSSCTPLEEVNAPDRGITRAVVARALREHRIARKRFWPRLLMVLVVAPFLAIVSAFGNTVLQNGPTAGANFVVDSESFSSLVEEVMTVDWLDLGLSLLALTITVLVVTAFQSLAARSRSVHAVRVSNTQSSLNAVAAAFIFGAIMSFAIGAVSALVSKGSMMEFLLQIGLIIVSWTLAPLAAQVGIDYARGLEDAARDVMRVAAWRPRRGPVAWSCVVLIIVSFSAFIGALHTFPPTGPTAQGSDILINLVGCAALQVLFACVLWEAVNIFSPSDIFGWRRGSVVALSWTYGVIFALVLGMYFFVVCSRFAGGAFSGWVTVFTFSSTALLVLLAQVELWIYSRQVGWTSRRQQKALDRSLAAYARVRDLASREDFSFARAVDDYYYPLMEQVRGKRR